MQLKILLDSKKINDYHYKLLVCFVEIEKDYRSLQYVVGYRNVEDFNFNKKFIDYWESGSYYHNLKDARLDFERVAK